ncbi:MAG: T9SS type A sorting domain-containing protein [Rhodothermales bacterium]|nr:T9SS type A sorting domain-containing protein [Rhodothermales bacterium]
MRYSSAISVLLLCFCASNIARAQYDQRLIVDGQAVGASDANDGTATAPLLTVSEAIRRAIDDKREYKSTHVVIRSGIYRESVNMKTWSNVVLGEYSTSDPNNDTPILVEAEEVGGTIISGSDVWEDWTQQSGGVYAAPWTEEWSPDGTPVQDRRELVFINGSLLRQVVAESELAPGTFFVDQQGDRLLIAPESGNLDGALVEVGARQTLWDLAGEFNVTIRGLTFEHAVTKWAGGQAAVRIVSTQNVIVEDADFRFNNWQGIYFGESDDVAIYNSLMNHNGGQGWNTWRVRNFVAEDNETSYNNWRGDWGQWHGWNVGNKLESTHGMIIRNHKAIGNLSRGLWLDFDVTNTVLDNVLIAGNLLDGLWFEANQGPITLKNSRVCENGRSGLRTTYTRNVILDANLFYKNAHGTDVLTNDSQFSIDGGGIREAYDFETNEVLQLTVRNWQITNNTFVGGVFHARYANGPTLLDSDLNDIDFAEFTSTLTSNYNTWFHPDREAVFGFPSYDDVTLDEWRVRTGQDLNSTFAAEAPVASCEFDNSGGGSGTGGGSGDGSGDGSGSGSGGGSGGGLQGELSFYGEPVGTRLTLTVPASDISAGDRSALLVFDAFDINDIGEVQIKINGHYAPLPQSVIRRGEWKTDSVAVPISAVYSGSNEVTLEFSGESGGIASGFKIRNISMRFSDREPTEILQDAYETSSLTLLGNFPNPFNPSTTISFTLEQNANVSVEVFDMLGRRVFSAPKSFVNAGTSRRIELDGSRLASGNYVYRVIAETESERFETSSMMTILK